MLRRRGEPKLQLETAQAAWDANLRDYEEEQARTASFDTRLTAIAAFSGVSISVAATLGSRAVQTPTFLGVQIATGALLVSGVVLLIASVARCFAALSPKLLNAVTIEAAKKRTSPDGLRRSPANARGQAARTLVEHLEARRTTNKAKGDALKCVFRLTTYGFVALALSLVVSVVALLFS